MLGKELMHRLYGADIYEGFTSPLAEDLQGWNSQAPVFVEAIETSQPRVIFDVGVWKGASSIFLAESLRERRLDAVIISIDNFLGSVEHWQFSPESEALIRRRHGFPVLYEQFISNVIQHGLQDYIVPLPQTADAAAEILRMCGIAADIIHIDAAHDYESVVADVHRVLGASLTWRLADWRRLSSDLARGGEGRRRVCGGASDDGPRLRGEVGGQKTLRQLNGQVGPYLA